MNEVMKVRNYILKYLRNKAIDTIRLENLAMVRDHE